MARILYGVHGTGHGHAAHALAVARHYPQHEFLFVTSNDAVPLLKREFRVWECLNPETPIRNHTVDAGPALWSNLRLQWRRSDIMRALRVEIEKFRPDAALTDYEYFVPRVCHEIGLRCLSLDHMHVITLCRQDMPWYRGFPGNVFTALAIRGLFSSASHFMVTSFFQPPLRRPSPHIRVAPPLLRESILNVRPSEGDHVLAYQGYSTFREFVPFLQRIGRPVLAYGCPGNESVGNVRFRKSSEDRFLEDLASCRYVVCGGGHTLISEALYLGKPVLSFPIRHAFEQYENAFQVQRLGYGLFSSSHRPDAGLIERFETQRDAFQANIRGENFFGNPQIFSWLDTFFTPAATPVASDTVPAPPGG